MERYICSNCSEPVDKKYCPSCGSPLSFGNRLQFRSLFVDIFHSIFHTGGGLVFTLKELLGKPGNVLKGYISGKRKVYFSPIKLFLISSVIYLAINHWVNKNVIDAETKEISEAMSNFKYGIVFGNVFVNSFLNWLFFRKYRYSFPEHFVAMLYIQSMLFLISSLQMTFNKVFRFDYGIILSGFLLLYYVYAMMGFLDKGRKIVLILINCLLFLLSTVLFYLPVLWLILHPEG